MNHYEDDLKRGMRSTTRHALQVALAPSLLFLSSVWTAINGRVGLGYISVAVATAFVIAGSIVANRLSYIRGRHDEIRYQAPTYWVEE